MTAHCRPDLYDDFDLAADQLASIYARKGFGTKQHREAADVLRRLFDPPSSVSQSIDAAALPVPADSRPSTPSRAGRD